MDINKEIIGKIVSAEWEMFSAVNEGEARASCQEDRTTFEGMRRAQFMEWSPAVVGSYLDDLDAAARKGRNLIEEKYIHMMKTTEPSHYEALLERVEKPSVAVLDLAGEVSGMLLEQTRVLFEDYPYVSGQGRPLYSAFDYGGTSVETYQYGELLTYSEKTLAALKEHIAALKADGVSLARKILESTVRFYGYDSLDTAEAAMKERADKTGIQITFGCCAGGDCDCDD